MAQKKMAAGVALFARAPVAGQVKTRLVGRLSAERVCDLYRAFVGDMWEMLAGLRGERFLYADREHAEWRALAGRRMRLQKGEDLGQRMLASFQEMHEAGLAPLLILGSDSPALPLEYLAGWTAMTGSLLGPAPDGGYYAIGCRGPHPQMFAGVEWSSPRTLAQTTAALTRCGMPPAFLPAHYDVDTPADLQRLAAELDLGPRTRHWLTAAKMT